MMHMCVSILGHRWFRLWLVACSALSHYLNQFWITVHLTPGHVFQWNVNHNSTIFIEEIQFQNVVFKVTAILSRTKRRVTQPWRIWANEARGPLRDGGVHNSDVIMGTMTSQITSHIIVYPTVHSGADKENIKAPRPWPLCGEFPAQMASNAEMFPFDDVIMNKTKHCLKHNKSVFIYLGHAVYMYKTDF